MASWPYRAKIKNHEPRNGTEHQPRLLGGRLYVPQLGRPVSAGEWDRLMQIPALRDLNGAVLIKGSRVAQIEGVSRAYQETVDAPSPSADVTAKEP